MFADVFRLSKMTIVLALAAPLLSFILVLHLLRGVAPPPALLAQPAADGPNCRYGVGVVPQFPAVDWIPTLGAGWYMTFSAWPPASPPANAARFVPTVRVRQDVSDGLYLPSYRFTPPLSDQGLGAMLAAHPGRLWVIGNEVDVGNVVQDNTYPAVYAHAYHEAYHYIKQRDPSAQVAIAPLSMMTPGRLQYLDIVWRTYLESYKMPMPVDVWTLHLYVLAEIRPWDGRDADGKIALGTDPALAKEAYWSARGPALVECARDEVICRAEHDSLPRFIEQILALRRWMQAHGQQDKPLLLSEFALLYPFVDYDDPVDPTECFLMDEFGNCFTPNRVQRYLEQTFAFLHAARDAGLGYPADDYRLVQQWLWYSLITDPEWSGGSSSLLVQDYATYPPGAAAALSQVGHAYRDAVLAQPLEVNLRVGAAQTAVVRLDPPAQTVTATLRVDFVNNGNTAITQPFRVTFYADAALTQTIGSVDVDPPIDGCAGRVYAVSLLWEGLPVGTHPYWVKVDSAHAIEESNESVADNVSRGAVIVSPTTRYLPLILRAPG